MHIVLPAARSLRSLYVLGSDRLWFTLAVAGGLILAGELVQLLLLNSLPPIEVIGY
ncbi:hypothetical protein [Pararhodobacter sp. CCB-MM2]|uniref:hypothetical protein n=1 Tax=Pararhodobacter sp. CCB-MM2 TaxID=1786003 RepID=UPI001313E01F|nr:hypothetical protein [Pararhodobacter sp. CCB-MM2]MCA2010222.1 hypothetical protein [Cereibacter sphaeroides]